MSDITEIAGVALRSIIARANADDDLSDWSIGYYQGQIDIVSSLLEPDALLLEGAKRAVDAFRIRQINARRKPPM